MQSNFFDPFSDDYYYLNLDLFVSLSFIIVLLSPFKWLLEGNKGRLDKSEQPACL